jgi:hypothetical protein
MSKPVAGDIDGDGDLEIYQASQDVAVAGGYDGTVTMFDHLGNILHQTFSWRSCSGGLSLGDTDSDGVFELYMGDRQMGYRDGGYGKGTRSFWAENLTERWNRLDYLSSSQAPVLVDFNGDGIKDVLAGMYSEMNIHDSSNGKWIRQWEDNSMSVHYGFTVYDIDGDGHLELLANDGDHDNDPYTDVFDLVTGQWDAQLDLAGGDWKWGPLIADIDPTHLGMEIISAPNGTSIDNPDYPTSGGWRGAIFVWSNNYQRLQTVTRDSTGARLSAQLGYPIVQDIDGDDRLELVTHSSSGSVYAFDTQAPAPGYSSSLPGSQRIRSDVTYFGEDRLGVAKHTVMPWEQNYWTAPLVAPVSPGDNSLAVPRSTTQLSFKLREHQGQAMSYSVTTSPNIGSASGSSVGDPYVWRTYTVPVSGLNYDTTYTWTVRATDGTNWTIRTYTFRTAHAPITGSPPTQGTPSLVSQDGSNLPSSTFIASRQSTVDPDGDDVTSIYRWLLNGQPVANLLLPFDTRDETSTKDYSGYGNNGVVKGAVWTENGIVGGAYSFDGKDDAIIVSDGGLGYFNDVSYSTNNPELGGDGTWDEVTVEAWIRLAAYNNGSRIVAKIPSYELGFQSGYTNRLIASVWPTTGQVSTDDNAASLDRQRSVSATVDIQLNTWYHIAFTYKNGTGLRLYFNGQQVAESLGLQGRVKDSLGEKLYIGRLVEPFKGSIDEVRLYSRSLSAAQIQNRYLESKDGLSSSSFFNPTGLATTGQTLRCEVTPTDSFQDGPVLVSNSITLGGSVPPPTNHAPVASNLRISPNVRNKAPDTVNLIGSYTYYDADGDPESGTEIRWYRNGVLQTALNDQLMVPASLTFHGDSWYFTVRPKDGTDFGTLQTSSRVTINKHVRL